MLKLLEDDTSSASSSVSEANPAGDHVQVESNYETEEIPEVQRFVDQMDDLRTHGCLYCNVGGEFTRWLWRDPLAIKFTLAPFLNKKTDGCNLKLRINYLLQAATIPQPHITQIRIALVTEGFFKGARFVTQIAWPIVFTGLLAHDFINYFTNPNSRYGIEWWQILAGTTDNQGTWSTYLTGDIPASYLSYSAVPVITFGGAIVAGLLNVISRYGWSKVKTIEEIGEAGTVQNKEVIFKLRQSWDLTGHYINQIKFALLWNGQLDGRDIEELMDVLLDHATNISLNPFKRMYARRALAEIADSFKANKLPLFKNDHFVDHLDYKEQGDRARSRLARLGHQTRIPWGLFAYLHLQYLQWSLGEKSNFLLQPLFWLFSSFLLYTQARLWQQWVTHVQDGIEYKHEKQQCEQQNFTWNFNDVVGNYDCRPCGDWDFLYVGDTFDLQSCWSGLFKANRSYDQLSNGVIRLINSQGFQSSIVDLSQQTLSNWTQAQWQGFLDGISGFKQLQLFNLSQPMQNPIYINNGQMTSLNHFMQTVSVINLDLTNQGMGDTPLAQIATAFNQSAMEQIILTGNGLSDQGISSLISYWPLSLQSLSVANNRIGNFSVAQIANQISNAGTFNSLNLANNPLGMANLVSLWQASTNNPSFNTLVLSGCQISDTQLMSMIPFFNQTAIQEISLANNGITDTGLVYFFAALAQSKNNLTSVDFGNNKITDNGIMKIAGYLQNTNITSLGLASNRITGNSVTALLTANSKLSQLNLANIQLGDAVIVKMANILNTTSSQWDSLNLVNNGLTDDSADALVTFIQNNQIKNLYLSNNLLTSATITKVVTVLPGSSLQELFLNDNNIDGDGGEALAEVVAESNLKVIDLSGNPLGDLGFVPWVKTLVNMPDLSLSLLEEQRLNFDEQRDLYNNAKANSLSLNSLSLADTGANATSAQLMCHLLPYSNYNLNSVQLNPNAAVGGELDLSNCRPSDNDNVSSSLVFAAYKKINLDLATKTARSHSFKVRGVEMKARAQFSNNFALPSGASASLNLPALPSSSANNQPSSNHALSMLGLAGSIMPFILGLIVLYLLYRMLKPVVGRAMQSISFFASTDSSKDQEQDCEALTKQLTQ